MRDRARTRIRPLALAGLGLVACRGAGDALPADGPPITAPFRETFDRVEIGPDWRTSKPDAYRIEGGALVVREAYNHPLWLARPLPPDVVVELDVWSNSPAGDIKIELHGDGRSHARDKGQYTSTGVVAVMGGWSNSVSVLVAGNEHRADRPERRRPKVEVGRRYHWKLVKQGDRVDWYVDDVATPFLTYVGEPLAGPGHAYLAINDWQSECGFDNLTITPL